MINFNRDESHKEALNDMKMFFYKLQIFKPKIHYTTKKTMVVSPKNILDMFKIDLMNHRKARLALHYHLHTQPSEIDNMWYMDFEYLLIDLAELLKSKNEAEKDAQSKQQASMPDYGKQMKGMSNFKPPSMPKF